jgi:hypothetical protein
MRRIPTADDRFMERARISAGDMQQAVIFIDAALALDEAKPPNYEVARLALEIAAVIYYARPFTGNENPRRKTKRAPAKGAPRLSKIDIGPLAEALSTREARSLHRDVLNVRHKIVAHAESRYFPVRLVKSPMAESPHSLGDYAIRSGQRYPRFDLHRLRANAKQLGAVFGLHAHMAAGEVRKTRKRLHQK